MKHLKLFFALFAMLALGVTNAWAEEVSETISYSNHKGKGTSSTGSEYTMNGDKFSITDSKFYCDASKTYAQFYANSTITITPSAGVTIKSIVITATSSSYNGFQSLGTFTPSIGSITKTDNTHITWTGPATSKFTVSHNKQIRWTTIEVTYEETTSGGSENPGEGGGEDPETGDDATMTAGTNGTACTVNGKDGIKVGTSSKGGDMKITVPAGATMLHVYAAAWKGVTGLSLNITPASNVTTTSIALTADAGIANSTPFTLSGDESDYLFDIPLQNITTETTLTFTSSTTKRFVVWGATYETAGGDEPGTGETDASLTDEQLKWSEATAEATMGAENTFPTLTNALPVSVKYESSTPATATIDATTGDITLVAPGKTTISAIFEGGEVNGTKYAAKTVDYTLTVKPAPLEPIAGGVIDILDNDWSGLTTSDYATVAAKTAANTGHSNAQYTAQCAGSNSSIQLRSNNSNSGIVSTVSGGLVKRVEIEWNDATSAGRTLNIYGSNTPYTNPTDLYDTNKDGDKLGTIEKGTSTYLEISEDYRYIGIRSASGAMYLAKVTITWLPINSKVSIDDAIQHGSVRVTGATDLNAVAAGTVLTLDNTPEAGYKFVKYNVYKTDEPTTEIDVENSKFTMPEYDVTVSATFTSIKELDKIEVNTTNVKKTFWQGEAFSSDGLEVTAYYTDGTSAEVTPTNITGGNTANAGEITVTVSYTEGSNTKTTTYNITVKAIENNETTVYTVAQAREIIDAVGNTTVEVYVQGIVSNIVTAFNPTYGNISYDISTDGLKTSDQLQAYRGFSYDGDWFTSADDIQVGDVVVVKGKLKLFNTTYELDEGNQLVKLERSDEPKPTAASLPFEFDGNKDDIADVVGMSHEGLGNYSTSPKLKFDDENDNVIIHFDGEPGEFSFALKQNGQNAGTFTVYESENGEDYTSVWSGGNLGNGQTSTIESTLSSTTRYVKFELTTKGSSTNYGLGSISIQKVDHRAEAGIAWNPATVSLTVGDAFTAPTFNNPNGLSGITFASSNEALATVNNAGAITLVSGKTGTATITATFADGHADYKPAEVTCTINVDHKSEDVVILAKCKDQYYALVAEYVTGKTDVLKALPVEYVGGKIYNVETEDQASIIWKRSVVDGKTTFKNGDNYLSAVNSAALKLEEEACDWIFENDMYKIEGSTRTILYYTSTGGFKNYATTNMSKDGVNGEYSSAAITVAPVFADGDAYHRTTTPNKFGTICLPFGSTNYTGATFYEFVGSETGKVYLGSVTTLEAGVPYIFEASATEVAVYGDGTTAATPGRKNGLVGTFTNDTEVAVGNYILKDNAICEVVATCWVNAYRAYIVMSEVPTGVPTQMPGRRYIGMSVQGENEATGFENITAPEGQTIKAIVNGQLVIIRGGEMYNVQGQKL